MAVTIRANIHDLPDFMFITELCQYIGSVRDYWALANTCQRYNIALKSEPLVSNVKKMLLRNLDLVLRSFHLDSRAMRKILSATYGSILSGSSVLQAYLGEQWDEPSDLDIYIPYNGLRYLSDRIILAVVDMVTDNFLSISTAANDTAKNREPTISLENENTNSSQTDYRVSTIYGPYIHESINGKIAQINLKNGRKIQLIFVKTFFFDEDTAHYVMKAFDLTVVQNSFDGICFHSRYINHVLHKKMEFTSYYPGSQATDGTPNTLPYWVPEHARLIDEQNILRLQKYERRGFAFVLSRMPLRIQPFAKMYLLKVSKRKRHV